MDFDVIVVGGRPAGSTLAARLGQGGLRVALLERDSFPTPHPASSPAIYAGTMAMLDEIGAEEARYAAGTPRIKAWVIEAPGAFVNRTPIPAAFGRDTVMPSIASASTRISGRSQPLRPGSRPCPVSPRATCSAMANA